MTDEQATKLGKSIREAAPHNLLVNSFAAELVGESYPFSKAMRDIVIRDISDIDLGRKFAKWMDKNAHDE
jgi:hypothetical protein